MNLPKQLVILGGGASVKPAIDNMGLFDLLPKIFCAGCNYSYRFVQTTLTTAVDEKFFNEEYKEIINLPLFLSKVNSVAINAPYGLGKAYFFPSTRVYDRDCTGGIYSPTLVGLFTLSVFIKLMDIGEIFLLGYDYGPTRDEQGKPLTDNLNRPLTHWYQGKVEHRGVGKINWYTATSKDAQTKGKAVTNAEKEFGVYKNESKIKIYNVNPQSTITAFEKISYEQFFEKLDKTEQNQAELRYELERRFKGMVLMWEMIKRNGVKYVPRGLNMPGQGPFRG